MVTAYEKVTAKTKYKPHIPAFCCDVYGEFHLPTHTWCFVGEVITDLEFSGILSSRQGVRVRDRRGRELNVYFENKRRVFPCFMPRMCTAFCSNGLWLIFCAAALMCMRFAIKSYYMDMEGGVLLDDAEYDNYLHVIPDVTMSDLMKVSNSGVLHDYLLGDIVGTLDPGLFENATMTRL